jgi:uncharacterized membrane protein
VRKLLAAPLHPIFTHFTIALTTASLAFDAFGRLFGVSSLSAAGWWTIATAVPVTVGTLASGVTSRVRLAMEEGEARAWLRAHAALGPTFFGGLIAIALWRASLWAEGESVSLSYLATMTALVLLMTVQGYLGGELVYRFGAEVQGQYARLPSARREVSARTGIPPIRRDETTARRS